MSSNSKVFFHFTTSVCPEVVPLFGKAVESVLIAFDADEDDAEEAAEIASIGFQAAIENLVNDDVESIECRILKTDTGCQLFLGSKVAIKLDLLYNALAGNEIWKRWLSSEAPQRKNNNFTLNIKF